MNVNLGVEVLCAIRKILVSAGAASRGGVSRIRGAQPLFTDKAVEAAVSLQ
jgi:hypothetical protein